MTTLNTPRRGPRSRPLRLALALLLALAPAAASAQGAPEPRREQLLNGLRILALNRPGDPQLLLRLRIHSGAAFDLAGKEGLMALLGDALFDAQTREYVREELGGRLEVSTGLDAVDVTLSGRAQDFDRLLELIRNAVTNMRFTNESVAALREARRKTLAEAETAAAAADRAAAARLFNVHPYARPAAGTPESVARVERADLMLIQERFLNPNNATLVVVGDVQPARLMRALRQSLGGWRKSDGLVPETFRRPEAPDARTLVVNRAGAEGAEVRLAVRGLARADRDRPAAQVLAALVRERWLAAFPELRERAATVRHEAHREGGLFVLSASVRTSAEAAKALETARAVLNSLASNVPSAAELDAARRAFADTLDAQQAADAWAASWLDEHSYKSPAVTASETARAAAALTPDEAQRVAARLFLHTPSAAVAVGDAEGLRAELARLGGVEVFGEQPPKQAQQPPPPPPARQQPAIQLKRP
ncbi:MAG TPA: pitrilysin family protein [Pyrinomonadaceae bacterium]|nr:pitrilysin family protein [Pyrinomonadaceae bacterium]